MTSVLVPIVVSLATTLVTGVTVRPRLAARAKRIQAAFDSRDQFGDTVLDMLAVCSNLEGISIPVERERWLRQIDEMTTWLVDHWQRVALGYAGAMGVRDLIGRYIGAARGVWLSGRPEEVRVRMLRELTEPIQTIYFARRWRVVRQIHPAIAQLRARLDALE